MPAPWICLLAVVMAASGLLAADDRSPDQPGLPLRLKKKAPVPEAPEKKSEPAKKESDVRDKKKGDAKEDQDLDSKDPQQEAKELLTRVSKNMRASEDRLAKKDPGEGTRQIQRDIVKDLDALIEQAKRQQQQQQQQSSSSSSASSRPRRDRQGARNSPSEQQAKGQNKQPREAAANNPGAGSRGSEGRKSKIADLYKDVWGHLPETLRQEMDQYSREEFMAKYSDLLKQYYAAIAEKGRKEK